LGQILLQDSESTNKISTQNSYFIRLLILFLLIGGMIMLISIFHLEQYLENERLRNLIAGYGDWAPIAYLLFWLVTPFLFLPVTPILLMGGFLFGPFWGEIYALLGATTSAVIAFLVARYLARDFVASKIATTRLVGLDDLLARHGWKLIIISRIQPIFPFFLLNFAFGLTKIPLAIFVIATFFGLIPSTMAYVFFSANLIELLKGNFSWGILLALILLSLVIISPIFFRQFKSTPKKEE
jgi:uncharacterized membrane protein YdjX (TVP38/TMEM64 family)